MSDIQENIAHQHEPINEPNHCNMIFITNTRMIMINTGTFFITMITVISSASTIQQGTKYKIDKFEFGTKYKIGRPKSFFYKFEFVGDQDVETVCGFQLALINRQKLSLRSSV